MVEARKPLASANGMRYEVVVLFEDFEDLALVAFVRSWMRREMREIRRVRGFARAEWLLMGWKGRWRVDFG